MPVLNRLRERREALRVLEEARRAAEVDDAIPIDEVRPADGDVARCARRVREVLGAVPAPQKRIARLQLAGLLRRLGTAERIEADQIYRAVRAEAPRDLNAHWGHGLLLKHSGRFDEALEALAACVAAGGSEDEAYHWNVGICAIGAGKGAQALEAWRALGLEMTLGDDGLPVGEFAAVQVRIASRGPICDPTRVRREGEPECEYGWVQRLSPCHGVLVTPLMLDEPADVGDTILWDGAPVRLKVFDGEEVPTFPLLAVLRRAGYLRFRFRGEQREPGLVAALEESLPRGTLLYVHDEQVQMLCRKCATSGATSPHEHDGPPPRRIVRGKLAIPPSVEVADLRARLEESLRVRPSVRLAVPGLHRHAGDLAAAKADEALWAALGAERVW